MGKRVMGPFGLSMMTIAAIMSLRNLSLVSSFDAAAIFYYGVAGLIFLVPTALVCAELGATIPGNGGVYAWVSAVFGPRRAFISSWAAWIISIAWYPTALSFAAATIATLIDTQLASNGEFLWFTMMCLLWGATFLNFFGLRWSSALTSLTVMAGTIFPGLLLIGLGGYWFVTHPADALRLQQSAWVPEWTLGNLVFLSGVILGFGGMEVAGFHVQQMKHPQRDYPKALLLSALFILVFTLLASLAISLVIPKDQLSILTGSLHLFVVFFERLNHPEITQFIIGLIFVGTLAGLMTWIISPAKGILAGQGGGFLPAGLGKVNRHEVPVAILVLQASIATVLSSVYLLVPHVQSAYWFLTAFTTQVSCLFYATIFITGLYVRKVHPHSGAFRIPGGNWVMNMVCILGLMTALVIFILDLVPPQGYNGLESGYYVAALVCGPLLLLLPAVVFALRKK
ncbi:MAG: APC family permease [Pseudomonadota bacterium]